MQIPRTSILALALLCASARAQTYLYDQLPAAGGGTLRASQLWVDPTGQNDSDNDAIAWEDFELAQDAVVTGLRWWGDAAPPLGFQISFFRQDPNTVAVQPDMFAPGSGPLSEQVFATVAQTPAGTNLFRMDVTLTTPILFRANQRYFVSVVGLEPLSYVQWRWAASTSGPNGTFWWQRGMHMYFHLPESRAVSLAFDASTPLGATFCSGDGSSGACPCGNSSQTGAGCANSTGAGAALAAAGSASVAADDLHLLATGLPALRSTLAFVGAKFTAGTPFGDGRRCIGSGTSRLWVQSSSAAGQVDYGPGLRAYSVAHFPAANQLLVGKSLGFQVWYRDPVGPCGLGTNLTNALAVGMLP